MLDGGDQRRVGDVGGQFNRQNDVVEAAHVGWHLRRHRTAFGVDDDIERLDAGLAEHGTEKRGLVLAIAIAMREYLGGSMGLPASNAQFNSDVANVVLHEQRQRLHFLQRSVR